MEDRYSLIDRWICEPHRGGWAVKLEDGTIGRVGDRVAVKFDNGIFPGVIKQTAGFGNKELRPVISVLFKNRKKGIKVHITNVLNKL